jgi:nucleoid DNA-binding protein
MSKFTRAGIWAILEAAGMDRGKAASLANRIITALAAALAAGETVELRGLGGAAVPFHHRPGPVTGQSLCFKVR